MTADRPSPARPGRWILVAAVLVIGLAVVFPGLWPFVAAGAVAAVAVEVANARLPAARRLWRRTRRPLAVAAGALGLAATLVSLGYIALTGGGPVSAPQGFGVFEVPGAYEATVTLWDEPERMTSAERLALSQEDLTRATTAVLPETRVELVHELRRLGVRGRVLRQNRQLLLDVGHAVLIRRLHRDLLAQGWRLARDSNVARRYQRMSERPLEVSAVIPARRHNEFRLRGFDEQGELVAGLALVRLGDASTVTLVAPRNALGEIYPSPRSRQSRVAAELDEATVALGDAREPVVEFDVRSPPFRGPPLSWVLGASVWSPLKWLIALLVALASDTVREWLRRLLTGAWRWIRPTGRPARPRRAAR
jgi:hypothetical protein